MTVSLAELTSASARLHNPTDLSDELYDDRIRDLVAYFRHLLSTDALSSFARDDSLLDNFDPSADSVAFLLILRLQIQKAKERTSENLPGDVWPTGKLWTRAVQFLKTFDSVQVRYVGQEWRQLVELPLLGARVVRDAMLRLDPSCAVFTSTHLLLVRLCLRARTYSCALPVLDKHICYFPALVGRTDSKATQPLLCSEYDSSLAFMGDASGFSSKLSSKDYLQYFLYGGMIYMALKQWRKALHFLGIVISMPIAGSLSMIMVEAYKKWILVGLLEKGKLCPPPSLTSPHAAKMYQSLTRPYITLAQTFERDDVGRLKAEVNAAEHVWSMDNNTGLVAQVTNAFYKHTVIRLGKTFAALTMADLAGQALPWPTTEEDAESIIASLVMSGDLAARLLHSQKRASSTMLRLSDVSHLPRLSHEMEVQIQLRNEGRSLKTLMSNLEQSSHQLGLSNEYIDNVQKSQLWAGSGENTSEQVGLDMDEDIMGDLH
ncbi:hypothetical protein N7474_007067 [Penicillium riverlandense]|uniref:uncharacterized protein n=1 Tax=Penicillium riverlandense TaxID=1903569 RepID=UPI0025490A31|nr:uncharacterized protein N7474_007067 [Penicillium riverlandense]KAJ5815290.1 hypothetical protein N7474_007067 [Penicillium riverlandense]